jgi:hypothetical protein
MMNKLIATLVIIVSSILINSCTNSPNNTENNNTNSTSNRGEITENKTITAGTSSTGENNTSTQNTNRVSGNNQPTIATVKELVTGDIICYATLVDDQGKQHNIGASFEICAQADKYLNQKVRASYEIASLNDCESAEPCGKSRQESIISQMEILQETSTGQPQASQLQTFTNGKWTITIGGGNSWSGVNNTGNLSYKGCDDQGNCIKLTGGTVNCRRGECVMGWVNGDYRYIFSQPITEDGTGSPTLIVKQGDREILKATAFKLL